MNISTFLLSTYIIKIVALCKEAKYYCHDFIVFDIKTEDVLHALTGHDVKTCRICFGYSMTFCRSWTWDLFGIPYISRVAWGRRGQTEDGCGV